MLGLALVERYIFRKALLSVLIAGGGLIGVLWVVRAVQTVDVILSKGQGIFTYLKMTTLGVPTLAAAIAPLALLIGLIRTINALNDDSELVVMHASGASRVSLLKPFLAVSLLVTFLVYFLHLWAGPVSMQSLRTYITKVRADLVSVVVKEGAFQDVDRGLTFHIAERAPGGTLNGVLIVDSRSPTEQLTYVASEGVVTKENGKSYLILRDGQIQRREAKEPNLSIIGFTSYAFNLDSFSGSRSEAGRSQREVSTWELIYPRADDPLYLHRPERYVAELHTRLSSGLYPLMVGLIILAFLGNPSSHRQGQGLVTTIACLDILGLRAITITAEGAVRGNLDLVYVIWLVPLVAMAFASYLLLRDKSAMSPELIAWIENWLLKISSAFRALQLRIRGGAPKKSALGATS